MKYIYYALLLILFPCSAFATTFDTHSYSDVSTSSLKAYLGLMAVKYDIVYYLPTMEKIVDCESSWNPSARHVNTNGTVDVSLFQFNEPIWRDTLAEKNLDIFDPFENIEAGVYVIATQSSRPWKHSWNCWKPNDILSMN